MNTQNLEKSKMENNNKVYEDLLDHVMHLLNDHQKPVELVAGSMMAIAQRLYKTALNAEEYERMMDVVRDAPVRPYKIREREASLKDNILAFIEKWSSRINSWAWDKRWKYRDHHAWIKGYKEWKKKN